MALLNNWENRYFSSAWKLQAIISMIRVIDKYINAIEKNKDENSET